MSNGESTEKYIHVDKLVYEGSECNHDTLRKYHNQTLLYN